jgi:tetratricopeptide (TPR) repeat protein
MVKISLKTTGIISFISIFLISCNPQPEATSLLSQAEALADQDKTDSALALIDSIFYPESSFNKEKYMQYLVTRVRLRYKAYRDIKGDTTIFAARKYFRQQADKPRWAALATFYSGCVYREQGNTKKAMADYTKAATYAAKTGDNDLKGLIQNNIGDLFYEQALYQQALAAYKKACPLYADLPLKQIQNYSCQGATYLLMRNERQAQVFIEKGLQLARRIKDRAGESLLLQNMSIAYSTQKDYKKALFYLQESYKLNTDSTNLARYYLNFSNLYMQMGKTDSAEFYGELAKRKAPTLKDNYLRLSIYNTLANLASKNKNYKEEASLRLHAINVFSDILKSNSNQAVMDVYQKYNFEQEKATHAKLINKYLAAVILLLLAIIAGGAAFTWYLHREKKSKHEIQANINTLAKMASDLKQSYQQQLQERETNLREQLLWKFDVIRKSALLLEDGMQNLSSGYLLKEFKHIVYRDNEEDIWENMLPLIDSMENNLSERIRLQFPNLSENEFPVCLLTYAGLHSKEIAIVLGITQRSVQTIRTQLRKKIGIDDAKTDTAEYLKRTIKPKQI